MIRHSKYCEPPLPVYLGILLHTKTGKYDLVEQFLDMGLSVSYDRVIKISSDVGTAICKCYVKLYELKIESKSIDDWSKKQQKIQPMFTIWLTIHQLQLIALVFVKSIENEDFHVYIQSGMYIFEYTAFLP